MKFALADSLIFKVLELVFKLLYFTIAVLVVPYELVKVYFFLRYGSSALVSLCLSFSAVALEFVWHQNHLLAVIAFVLFLVRLICILLLEF